MTARRFMVQALAEFGLILGVLAFIAAIDKITAGLQALP